MCVCDRAEILGNGKGEMSNAAAGGDSLKWAALSLDEQGFRG